MPSTDLLSSASLRGSRRRLLVALGLFGCLLGVVAAMTPMLQRPMQNTEIFLPAYAAATVVLELITAALLMALYDVRRTPGLLVLASGYLFSALMVPAWALSFPGVFAGVDIEAGLQTTAVIAATRRLTFPLFVLGYALTPAAGIPRVPARGMIGRSVLAVCILVALILAFIFTNTATLPNFMSDARVVNLPWRMVPPIALGLYALGFGVLLYRRRSALDIWVCLVLASLSVEILLISYLGDSVRFSVGWWTGRLYGLGAASIILLVLLSETTSIYARLAQTVEAERRARQNRLTAMEALSASIAHEVNQPLASMVTNADAALRWLAREEPRLDKVRAALRRIVEDGHRANKVVSGIRTMFLNGTPERTELDLNALVVEAVRIAAVEARIAGVRLIAEPAPGLPPVVGNAVQLGQVLCNLIDNGIDALRTSHGPHKRLTIRTARAAFGEVRVEVVDTGDGIAPGMAEQIFEPFVSTKHGGMGMGLMFCRAVVEAHGGRLWVEPAFPSGAAFHFTLPAVILPPVEAAPAREEER